MNESTKKMMVISPATGKVIGEVEETHIEHVQYIVDSGRLAFQKWKLTKVAERLSYFLKLKDVLVNEMETLAELIAKDTGKVVTEALVADIMPTLDALNVMIKEGEAALRPKRVKTPLLLFGKKSWIEYMPMGLVLVISPWNYPFQLSMVPLLSALLAGNAVILKPSEVTPLVGKYIEDLFQKAGFPKDLVQVAHGGKELGARLTASQPDYIFFTGSVRTGKIIQKVAAEHLIPTTLELGGKDPMIVFADAHLSRAAKAAVWGAFTNSGQVCMSTERLYVEKSVFEHFLQLILKEIKNLRQGMDEDADVGSMTFPAQVEIVQSQLQEALAKGAKLQSGTEPGKWKEGMFLPLTVVTDVSHDMKIIQEEAFGPLLPVIPFDTEEEAVRLANDTVFGLNSSVWSSDLDKAKRVASQLICGAVVINDVLVSVANHYLPFGGAKQSGVGRYHGANGITMFCHEKAIVFDNGRKQTELQWYPYKGKYRLLLKLFKSYFGNQKSWLAFLKHYRQLTK